MRYSFYTFFIFSTVFAALLFGGGQGYHQWQDELNDFNYAEPHFHDAVPITPYENPNPVFYDYSPYLNPDADSQFIHPY